MDNIGFNQIPGSGLTAPLFAFEANSGGQYDVASRLILFGHKTSSGSLPVATPTVCTSLSDADAFCGPGSQLREMFRIARQNAAVQEIWLVAVAETGVAEVRTLTVGSVPASGGTGYIDIQGERLPIVVQPGDSANTVAATINAAINGYYNALTGAMLPITSTVATNVVTITSRHAGAVFSEIDIFLPVQKVNNLLTTSWITFATTTAGSGTPTSGLNTAIAALGDQPADMIVNPWSDSTSVGSFTTYLSDQSGRWNYSRQTYGHALTSYTGVISAQTTLGLGMNDRHCTIVPRFAQTAHPSWLWAAGFAARVIPWLSDVVTGNVSRNQTGLIVEGLTPPRDPTLWPTYPTRNVLNNSGISGWTVTAAGEIAIDKLVTTYRTGPSGQPDSVFRDIQSVFQVSGGFSYLRALLATEHGQKSIADSNPGNLGAISTPKDIDATMLHGYSDLVNRGVFENVPQFATRYRGARNVGNGARYDILASFDRVNPLDIIAVNGQIYAQFPS